MVVVCPSNSPVKSHIRELHTRGITATSLTGDDVVAIVTDEAHVIPKW